MEFVALGVAALFAALNGRNDGGALLAAGVTKSTRRPLHLGLILAGAMVAAPLILGTRVAETLVSGIVDLEGRLDLLVIVVATTTAVVLISVRLGFATSIGLALVGALTGVGVGVGLSIDGLGVGRILILGAASPIVAALVGRAVSTVASETPGLRSGRRAAGRLRHVTYVVLCLAYGANDGQKALAVIALASGADLASGSQLILVAIVSAIIFLGGMVLGSKRVAMKLGRALARAYPIEIATADVVASAVVVTGASLGTPLSMTQAIAGATVGVASRTGWRYVRWPVLGRLALAWVLTFPITAVAAGLVAWATAR
jgi:PiT family inorganic phosphate transporter